MCLYFTNKYTLTTYVVYNQYALVIDNLERLSNTLVYYINILIYYYIIILIY